MPKKNILIVEDEYITALDLKTQILSKGDYDFEIVATGEEAVQKALHDKFDMVFIDIKLKGNMDGIEAAERIKDKKDTPVVYVTGNLDLVDTDRLKKTKPEGILRKPISDYELMEIVNKLFT
ncbi:response regulator [bacterium]|nr:response regulator [bacterium]